MGRPTRDEQKRAREDPPRAEGAARHLAAAIPVPPAAALSAGCRVSKERRSNKAARLVQPSSFFILLQHKAFLPSYRADDPKLPDAFHWLTYKEDCYEGLQAASPETRPCQGLAGSSPTPKPPRELLLHDASGILAFPPGGVKQTPVTVLGLQLLFLLWFSSPGAQTQFPQPRTDANSSPETQRSSHPAVQCPNSGCRSAYSQAREEHAELPRPPRPSPPFSYAGRGARCPCRSPPRAAFVPPSGPQSCQPGTNSPDTSPSPDRRGDGRHQERPRRAPRAARSCCSQITAGTANYRRN